MTDPAASPLLMKNSEYEKMKFRRLAVLLVTSRRIRQGALEAIGLTDSAYDYPELVDYVELLSGTNIPFDIIHHEDITAHSFFEGDLLRYAVVIFTVPLSSLTDATLLAIRDASFDRGISLLCSYTQADRRSKAFFGIEKFSGKKHLWPLKARIIRWPRDLFSKEIVGDYGLSAGLPGIRKRGFGKLSIRQTLLKSLKILKGLVLPFAGVKLERTAEVFATTVSGRPLAWSHAFGRATNYYVALHGDLYLDKFNEMHRLVRSAIDANSGYGMASVDLENSMVLRLDDPGACSADYLNNGGILEEDGWNKLGKLLHDKEIPLSVMYTPGWVDDGDEKSGRLFIDNKEVTERKAGCIYDSARVKYVSSNSKNGSYDHASEYRGLKKLSNEVHIDIHSHGLTHLTPDYENWSNAGDKKRNTQWYHEFYDVKNGRRVHSDVQLQAMVNSGEKINSLFRENPCALTPSGHRHDADSDLLAYNAGYQIFSADYTGILKNNIVIRNWKIPSVFLYLKDPSPFFSRTGYPFVGVVHDYEIKQGLKKFEDIIEKWTACGIQRFISMKSLGASLCSSLDVRYLEAESRISLSINMPMDSQRNKIVPSLSGSEVRLKIILPERTISSESLVMTEGASLLSVEQSDNNRALRILIKLNSPTVNIDITLQPSGSDKREYSCASSRGLDH
jgi:hypothetical protein